MRNLLTVKQEGNVKRYTLNKDRIRVGRAHDCEIRISHPQISRVHAILEQRGPQEYWVADGDLNGQTSRNGTYVNGKLISHVRLQDGDELSFGPNVKATFNQIRVGVSYGPRDTIPVEQQVPSVPSMTSEVPTQLVPKPSASHRSN